MTRTLPQNATREEIYEHLARLNYQLNGVGLVSLVQKCNLRDEIARLEALLEGWETPPPEMLQDLPPFLEDVLVGQEVMEALVAQDLAKLEAEAVDVILPAVPVAVQDIEEVFEAIEAIEAPLSEPSGALNGAPEEALEAASTVVDEAEAVALAEAFIEERFPSPDPDADFLPTFMPTEIQLTLFGQAV